MEDRLQDIKRTTTGRNGVKEKKTNFYVNLTREDVILELHEREVKTLTIKLKALKIRL